jgi:His/Glu/Gln/Arg/opine family amino acid ABC transporter permease subunit
MKPVRFLLIALLLSVTTVSSVSAQTTLETIRQRGVLQIITDAAYPPFESMENGTIVGFDRDIGDEIGKELGVQVEWTSTDWDGVLASLATNKADLIMAGVTITEERKKENAFSRPYFLSGQGIARRKGDTRFSTPEELVRGAFTAAVQNDTTGQFALEKRGMPLNRLNRFTLLPDAMMDLQNGKSDAVVADVPAIAALIQKNYPDLELVPGGAFVLENLGIQGRLDSLELIAAVNIALDRMMGDGRYSQIYAKWTKEPATLPMLARLYEIRNEGTPIPSEWEAKIKRSLTQPVAVAPDTKPSPSAGGSALNVRSDILREAFPVLLVGARLTLLLTLSTLILSVPLGLLIALTRLSGIVPLRAVATVYVEMIRGTPLLVQIYIVYFVLPAVGISLPPFVSGLVALSLNSAAYVSEIFRAGIQSIDAGQGEAARALGMSHVQAMRYIILPQTLRRVLPPLTNEAVALLKDSSLVSVVSLSELMRMGREIVTTSGAPTTVYLAVALLYLAMTLPLTALVRYLESRWGTPSRKTASRGKTA